MRTVFDPLRMMGRRVLAGALSLAMTAWLVPAGPVVATTEEAAERGDVVGDPAETDAPAEVPEAPAEDPEEAGEEPPLEAEPSAPELVSLAVGDQALLGKGEDGSLDDHAEVRVVGASDLSVRVRDADGDLAVGDPSDDACSRVEVTGPSGDTVRYALRCQEAAGADYVLDAGAVTLADGVNTVAVVLRDADAAHDLTLEREITIDTAGPEIVVTPSDELPHEGGFFSSRSAVVVVTDGRLVAADPRIEVAGGPFELSGWSWSEDHTRAEATVRFGEGTFGGITVTATDGVNETVASAFEEGFAIDATPPEIVSLEVAGRRGGSGGGEDASVDPRKASPTDPVYLRSGRLTVRVEDANPAGLEVACDDGSTVEVTDEGDGTYSLELPEGPCPGLWLSGQDRAGNSSGAERVRPGSLIVDTQAPRVDATVRVAGREEVVPLSGALLGEGRNELAVTVLDANLAEGGSGLVASGTAPDGTAFAVPVSLERTEGDAGIYVLALPDGAYVSVSVTARDRAGNASAPLVLTDLLVDTQAPRVSITDVTAGLRRGGTWADECDYVFRAEFDRYYFRRPVQVDVTVDEDNLLEGSSWMEVDGERVGLPDGAHVSWGDRQRVTDSLSVEWLGGGARHLCRVTYEDGKDARQTPLVVIRDKVGNATQVGGPYQRFVVDTTRPSISLDWGEGAASPSNVEGGVEYYSCARSVTTTVADDHWDSAQGPLDVIRVSDPVTGEGWPRGCETSLASPAEGQGESSYVTTFGDGAYRLWVEAHDLAGNRAEDRGTPDFVVDTQAPVIEVDFGDEPGHNGRYFDETRTMTVTVTERNFDPGRIQVLVTTSESDHDGQVDLSEPELWSSEGDRHTLECPFSLDGAYEVEVRGSDLACNEAEAVRVDGFVIDRTPPEVSVDAQGLADASLDGVDLYRRPIAWSVAIRDRNLDVAGASRSVAEIVSGNARVAEVASWDHGEVSADGVVTWRATVLFDEQPSDRAGQVSLPPEVRASDLAGNATTWTGSPFHVDRTAPSIVRASVSREASFVAEGQDYQFYNRPTSMAFSFHDPYGLESAVLVDPDGVYDVHGKVSRGSVDGSLTVELVDGTHTSRDAEYERDVALVVRDVAGNVRVWTIDREGNVTDDVGSSAANLSLDGRGIYPRSLVEDVTAPRISLSGVEAGAYYAAPQTVHVAVDEFNMGYLRRFEPTRAVVTITRLEPRAGGGETSSVVPASLLVGSGSLWAAEVPLVQDGHYRVVGRFADPAGNESNIATTGEFTIDQTPPTIAVSWDGEDARNDRYYDAPRTATVSVEEHNFDESLVDVTTTGSVGAWGHDGDLHTCTVSFGEGTHELSVSARDLAGNSAEPYSAPGFVVDTTAPVVVLGGAGQRRGQAGEGTSYDGEILDHDAYNGVVAPLVLVSDEANLDAGSVSYELVGGKRGAVTEEYAHGVEGEGNELRVSYADLGRRPHGEGGGYDVNADDVYVLRARASDLAGNTTEAELTFSVNRFGSNYLVTMDGRAGGGDENTLLTEAPTVLVREINVSGSASEADHDVVKEHANATSAIKRNDDVGGAGYRLETPVATGTAAGYGWAEYLYTVKSGNFGEGSDSDAGDGGQGTYRVNVSSEDAASNANSTADFWGSDELRETTEERRGTAQFTLDELGPEIDEIDLPAPLALGSAFRASFHVTDAITAGDDVEVTIDGERVDVDGPSDGRGMFSFSIPARSFAGQSVCVTVSDYAGRTSSVTRERLYVTNLAAEGTLAACALFALACVPKLRHRRAAASAKGSIQRGED